VESPNIPSLNPLDWHMTLNRSIAVNCTSGDAWYGVATACDVFDSVTTFGECAFVDSSMAVMVHWGGCIYIDGCWFGNTPFAAWDRSQIATGGGWYRDCRFDGPVPTGVWGLSNYGGNAGDVLIQLPVQECQPSATRSLAGRVRTPFGSRTLFETPKATMSKLPTRTPWPSPVHATVSPVTPWATDRESRGLVATLMPAFSGARISPRVLAGIITGTVAVAALLVAGLALRRRFSRPAGVSACPTK
jgi:hypothetical protein